MKKILCILLFSNYLNIFAYSLFGPLHAIYVIKMGGTVFHVGAVWSMYMLISGSLMFFFSKYSDKSRKNSKKMIVLGYLILACGSLAFVLVQSVIQIYIVQIINAIGVGMLEPAWKAQYADSELKGQEVHDWALYDGGNRILISLASLIGGIFITYYSFSYLFVLIFLMQITAAFLSIQLLKDKSYDK